MKKVLIKIFAFIFLIGCLFNVYADSDTAADRTLTSGIMNDTDSYEVSYTAGGRDVNGKYMGGTEMRLLTSHKGKLYGGIETWMDTIKGTTDPVIGAQILRLDSPDGQWMLDHHFDTMIGGTGREDVRNEGVTVLESVTFHTDKYGNNLTQPANILIAACRDFLGVTSVYTRNDDTGTWEETVISTENTYGKATIRSITLYTDKTGIDRIFAGALPTGVFSGCFNQDSGKIEWDSTPELVGFVGRPMAFEVCNGDLHVSAAPDVYRRNDATKTWDKVFTYNLVPEVGGTSGFRGMTKVSNPSGSGESLLVAGETGNYDYSGKIVRLDTSTVPYTAVVEKDVDAELTQLWGYAASYFVNANSNMNTLHDPNSGQDNIAIPIQHHPATKRDDAYYYLRTVKNGMIRYDLKHIDNTKLTPAIVLNSTRAIIESPFEIEKGKYFYVGGYDADNNACHNTAYILKAELSKVLVTSEVSPDQLTIGLKTGLTKTEFASKYVQLNANERLVYSTASETLGTGSQVYRINNLSNVLLKNYKLVIFGDVNGDSNIDSMDAGFLIDIENNKKTWDPITDDALYKAGDVNSDGNVDSIDAGLLVDVENNKIFIDQATGMTHDINEIPSPMIKKTVQYKTISGVSANLLSLDIYYKSTFTNAPIIFYVHGGSLTGGDKTNFTADKATYFTEQGYIFVSVNYRLSPAVKHPAHITDIADAFMFVYNNASYAGGNKDKIYIMGHSSGAHMVSLLATNNKYIDQAGGSLALIKGCISLDTEQYNDASNISNYKTTIGTSPDNIFDATPINFIAADKNIPPFLTFYNDSRQYRMEYQQPFIDKLNLYNIPAAAILAKGDTHDEVTKEIGTSGDKKTEIIMRFLIAPANVINIAQQYNYTTG